MKKNVFIMSALALSALVATSCSNQFDHVQVGGEATVVLTAQLPNDVQNHNGPRRAAAKYGDGKTSTTLDYAVYQVAADGAWTLMNDLSKTNEAINLSTTVKLQLVNGNTYAVIFWADAPTSIYTFNMDAKTVTADYNAAATNNEAYDAFYAVKTFTVNGASQETVELKRPFAQLNIGTADLAASKAAGVEVTKAGIKVNTYKTLNLKTGEVADPADVEFVSAALPTGETFPVSGYDYLTMNYLLMPADKKADNTITISYDNTAAGTRTFNNVPLQRNYRTNIYGNLLTSSAEFNVVITPDFDGAENIEVWDGTSTVEPQKDADNNYLVSTAAEWAWLTKQNGRYIKGVGNKVYITKDIDFGGHNVTSLKTGNNDVGISLDLIDGQGHKFLNILMNNNDVYAGYNASLISMHSTTLKNLTIENVTVVSTYQDDQSRAGVICAGLQGGTLTIDNVHIINANVTGVQSVAGFVGLVAQDCKVEITNSSIANSTISNRSVADESGFVAGFIGRVQGTAVIKDCNATNTTVDAFYAQDEDHATNPRRDAESIQPIAVKEYASRVPTASLTITNTPETGVTVNKKELATVVTTSEGLATAIAAGKSNIELAAGTYYLKGLTLTSDVTISATDAASTIVSLNLEATDPSYGEYYLDARGHKLTFSNVTYNQTGQVYAVMEHIGTAGSIFAKELVMNNCICNGTVAVVADKITLTGCTVNNNRRNATEGYPVIIFGNDNCNVLLDDCQINGVTKGIMLYAYQNAYTYNLTVKDCEFISTEENDKAAIELHTECGIKGELTISNTTHIGFPTSVGDNGLWHEIVNASGSAYGDEGTQTKRFKVTVDGVVKQEQVL